MSELLGAGNNDAHEIVFSVTAGTNHATPVDDTLSIEGMAADAKATGDAIDAQGATIQSQIDTLDNGKVAKTDIANNLTTTGSGKVLDARQGKTLKASVDELSAAMDGKMNFMTFSVNNGNSVTLDLGNNFRGILIGMQAGSSGNVMRFVTVTSSGSVSVSPTIYDAENPNYSFETDTNSLTITATGTNRYALLVIYGTASISS